MGEVARKVSCFFWCILTEFLTNISVPGPPPQNHCSLPWGSDPSQPTSGGSRLPPPTTWTLGGGGYWNPCNLPQYRRTSQTSLMGERGSKAGKRPLSGDDGSNSGLEHRWWWLKMRITAFWLVIIFFHFGHEVAFAFQQERFDDILFGVCLAMSLSVPDSSEVFTLIFTIMCTHVYSLCRLHSALCSSSYISTQKVCAISSYLRLQCCAVFAQPSAPVPNPHLCIQSSSFIHQALFIFQAKTFKSF